MDGTLPVDFPGRPPLSAMRSSSRAISSLALRPVTSNNWSAAHLMILARGSSSRSEEHTSEIQSLTKLVCRLLLSKKKQIQKPTRLDKTQRVRSTDKYRKCER